LISHVCRFGATPPALVWFGHTGVEVFFVLSGFLITSLLLEEHADTGSVSRRAFYLRRARRLGPAFFVMMAVVLVLGLTIPRWDNWPLYIGALTWSANWVRLAYSGWSPVSPAWSLSVEEQFYLIWALVLPWLVRVGRRPMLRVTVGACAVSALLPVTVVGNIDHAYYGTDTRAMPLLAGCALAMWMHGRPEGPTVRMAAPVGLLWIVLVTWASEPLQRVDSQLIALATVVVIWGTAQGTGRTFLNARWLRLTGERSYALYLWNLPIFCLLGWEFSAPLWVVIVAGLPVTWGVAALSWRFVEQPFLRHRSPLRSGSSIPERHDRRVSTTGQS
jgi:peptidoglycan/LPS O-acetylase OafA/YrhL